MSAKAMARIVPGKVRCYFCNSYLENRHLGNMAIYFCNNCNHIIPKKD